MQPEAVLSVIRGRDDRDPERAPAPVARELVHVLPETGGEHGSGNGDVEVLSVAGGLLATAEHHVFGVWDLAADGLKISNAPLPCRYEYPHSTASYRSS